MEGKSMAINCGVMKLLEEEINNADFKVRFECCWILANLLLGNSAHIQESINHNFIEVLFSNAMVNTPMALWALANITQNANSIQLHYLIEKGYLQVSNTTLQNHNQYKVELLYSIITSLQHILKSCIDSKDAQIYNALAASDLVSTIEPLQAHQSQKVYEAALSFMDVYIEHLQ